MKGKTKGKEKMKGKVKQKGKMKVNGTEKEYFFKICSGGLPMNGKPRFVSGLPKKENQETKIRFRWTSEEGKPRNQDS
ncbi:unnamed protein product [Rhizophagus irregularis]|nr:unnamed protein product [Rhizophagus irregularis]